VYLLNRYLHATILFVVEESMPDEKDLGTELESIWEQNLVEFLQADMELGVAMLHTAKVSTNPALRRKMLANVQTIIETVAHLERRIPNPAIVDILRDQANQLQRAVMQIDGGMIQ
jgi:hypothetical protein